MSERLRKHGLESSKFLGELVGNQTAIPVLTIRRIEDAVPLAEALVRGGLRVIEVALRTDCSLEAIRRISNEVPEVEIGAGTIVLPEHFQQARDAGARFAVSPFTTARLIRAAERTGVFYLPEAQTPTEAGRLWELGYSKIKLFPSYNLREWVEHVSKPVPFITWCATGGVDRDNAEEWLNTPGIWCVGGGWVVKDEMLANKQWGQIEEYAREIANLRR